MPLVWDSQLQALVETAPPLVYDPALEAYRETEGLAYDPVLDAWKKMWPEHEGEVLYDHGIFNVISLDNARNLAYGPSGYHSISGMSPSVLTIKYNADNIEIVQNTTAMYGTLFFDVPLDLTKYGTLEIVCVTAKKYYNPIIGFTQQIRDNFVTSACAVYLGDSQQNVLDISGLTGSHYLFFGAGRGNGEEVNVMKVYKLTLKE